VGQQKELAPQLAVLTSLWLTMALWVRSLSLDFGRLSGLTILVLPGAIGTATYMQCGACKHSAGIRR